MTELKKQNKTSYILTNEEMEYLVALNASESFKRNFLKLLDHFGTFKRVYHAGQTELKGAPWLCSRSVDSISRIREKFKPGFGMERVAKKNIRIITWWDSDYPSGLRKIPEPPCLIYVRGDITYEYELSVGIVGTRKASRYGIEQSRQFGRELASLGFTIISGGASGIDAEAHKATLEVKGKTFAVFGSGIDVSFPSGHAKLFEEISKSGALISEFPPGTMPEPYRFPIRNRIISGLARGVLVVQAPEKSGALITAEYALDHGKEVMALPGRIDNPISNGTNLLIRDGAKMILKPEDIPAIYNLLIDTQFKKKDRPLPKLDDASRKILENIGWEPCHIDELARRMQIPVAILSSKLLEMHMDGYIKELPGKRFVRIAT